MTPRDHAVVYYDHDDEAVTSLLRYVVAGLGHGKRVLVVTRRHHQQALDEALRRVHAIDPDEARERGQYVTLDAQTTLDEFVVDGRPDRARFTTILGGLLHTAHADGASVRAYGEMVGLLWEQGNVPAALELETLWNEMALVHDFHLRCGYPTAAVRGAGLEEVARVCELHSSVHGPSNYPAVSRPVRGPEGDFTEVFLPVPEAVSAMPQFVAAALRSWGQDSLLWDANLIATEMATNALRHRGAPFRGFVQRTDGVVRFGIEDIESGLLIGNAEGRDTWGERSVSITRRLAHRWGWDVVPEGSTAWAELVATG